MKLIQYLRECLVELKKASWPWDSKEKGFKKYKSLTDSTMVVVVAILLLGAYIALADILMRYFVEFVTNVGGIS